MLDGCELLQLEKQSSCWHQITLPALLLDAIQMGLLTNPPLALSYDNLLLEGYFLLSNLN